MDAQLGARPVLPVLALSAGERTRFWSKTPIPNLDPQTCISGVQVMGPERLGKQGLERGRDRSGAVAGAEDLGVGTKLVEDLTAGTAGSSGHMGRGVDENRSDAD